MLVDTGASMGLLDANISREYGFTKGQSYAGQVVGVGGESSGMWHTKKLIVDIVGVPLVQFLTTDLNGIVRSIERETGYKIAGIIGYPQAKAAEMKLMLDEGYILIGN
jgi:hypothetical protein